MTWLGATRVGADSSRIPSTSSDSSCSYEGKTVKTDSVGLDGSSVGRRPDSTACDMRRKTVFDL